MRRTIPQDNTGGEKLPPGILAGDLKYPKFEWTRENADKPENKVVATFQLWYTERFGWCIPTLLISKARGAQQTDRYYAISLNTEICTIGKGPHVLRTVEVHVTEARLPELQKFLDLKLKGEQAAGGIRDRISTRRTNTIMRRNNPGGSWF